MARINLAQYITDFCIYRKAATCTPRPSTSWANNPAPTICHLGSGFECHQAQLSTTLRINMGRGSQERGFAQYDMVHFSYNSLSVTIRKAVLRGPLMSMRAV